MLRSPYVIAATAAICAEDAETASDLRYPIIMVMALMFRGEIIPVPSVEDAKAWAARHPADAQPIMRITHGDKRQVHDGLAQLAAEYSANELMLVNVLPDAASRSASYRLIAEAFELDSSLIYTVQGELA